MRIKPVIETHITAARFPGEGVGTHDGLPVYIKNALPGQRVEARLLKIRKDRCEGALLQVLERAPEEVDSFCPHFGQCGGCSRQTLPYEAQLRLKAQLYSQVLTEAGIEPAVSEPILASPVIYGYRNKMEYTFGDEIKGGPLTLGMHRMTRASDVITTDRCRIAPEDFNRIQGAVLAWAREKGYAQYNRFRDEGFLRNLILRRGVYTGELLVALCTTSYDALDEAGFLALLQGMALEGTIVGVLHLVNDRTGDVVRADSQRVLFGRDWYEEQLMGLKFRVSFFSFFQTNPAAAQLLYAKAISYFSGLEGKEVFDLFSGTGTLAQVMAAKASRVTAVELVPDAVAAARQNAQLNGIENCTFIAGDVFEVLSSLDHKPECILVDPPRAGITPKAWDKILSYGVEEIVYISCNPVTLAENLTAALKQGYRVIKSCAVDQFPHTEHVECLVKLEKRMELTI